MTGNKLLSRNGLQIQVCGVQKKDNSVLIDVILSYEINDMAFLAGIEGSIDDIPADIHLNFDWAGSGKDFVSIENYSHQYTILSQREHGTIVLTPKEEQPLPDDFSILWTSFYTIIDGVEANYWVGGITPLDLDYFPENYLKARSLYVLPAEQE